jgi:hypothetical protein
MELVSTLIGFAVISTLPFLAVTVRGQPRLEGSLMPGAAIGSGVTGVVVGAIVATAIVAAAVEETGVLVGAATVAVGVSTVGTGEMVAVAEEPHATSAAAISSKPKKAKGNRCIKFILFPLIILRSGCPYNRSALRRLLTSKNMKNGAPTNEVITPTRNSAGEVMTLAMVSARIRKMAPPSAYWNKHSVVWPDYQPHHVGHDESDKSNDSAY